MDSCKTRMVDLGDVICGAWIERMFDDRNENRHENKGSGG